MVAVNMNRVVPLLPQSSSKGTGDFRFESMVLSKPPEILVVVPLVSIDTPRFRRQEIQLSTSDEEGRCSIVLGLSERAAKISPRSACDFDLGRAIGPSKRDGNNCFFIIQCTILRKKIPENGFL